MHARHSRFAARPRRFALIVVAALAGVATAALVSVAVARTLTLQVAKGASVSDIMNPNVMSKTETIVVNSRGHSVYMLSGDSKTDQKCKKAKCWSFWPPVTVAAGKKPTKSPGIRGRLRVWHHSGINQVTLNGHPLYTFSLDKAKRKAMGEGIQSFHGTWHVIKPSGGSTTQTPSTGTTSYPYG
jgi:predicted lipoprotein with Yx(FWY)xxD motif